MIRPRLRSRRIAVALAVLALGGTGVAAYGAASDGGLRYRTVAAVRGDVAEELSVAGTIARDGTSEPTFGTSGRVGRVRVEQGDEVRQGEVLAVLDRAALRAAVERARSEVATARARLAEDRAAQTAAVASATDEPSSSTAAGAGDPDGKTGDGAGDSGAPTGADAGAAVLTQLTAQQDAVVAAQSTASAALATATDRLTAQQQACADPVPSDPEPSDPEPSDPESTPDAAAGPGATEAVLGEACADALAAVQTAQVDAASAQGALQQALETLTATLAAALTDVATDGPTDGSGGAAPNSGGTPGTTSDPTPGGSTGQPGGAAGSEERTVTAATLAQDQAAVDQAVAALASARAELRGAVVRAPADGTVVALAVSVDDRVTAGDVVATVAAPGLTTVAVEVSAAQAAELATGTAAEVTPAGAGEPLAGTVGRIEHTATSTSDGSSSGGDPTYTVEVLLDERDLAVPEGMPATVTIVVATAEDVVVVPASAVTDGSVAVVDAQGRARRAPVTTGLVGATTVEVTDGVDVGDEVVLADLDAALPTGDAPQGPGGLSGGIGGGFGGGLGGGLGGDGVRIGPPPGVTIRR